MAHDRQELDRDHREDAGHQVENQPAHERERHDRQERRERETARVDMGEPVGPWQRAGLDAARAVDQGEGERIALEIDRCSLAENILRRHRGEDDAPILEKLEGRLREQDVLGSLDQQVRRHERRVGAKRRADQRLDVAARNVGTLEHQAGPAAVTRHLVLVAGDHVRELGRVRRARRQVERCGVAVGDTHFVADQKIDLRAQVHGLAGRAEFGCDRKDHLLFVAEGLQVEIFEADGRGPLERRSGQVGRFVPCHVGRDSGIARRAPVGLPAFVEADLDAERDRFEIADSCRGRDEADIGLRAVEPVGRRVARSEARPQKSRNGGHNRGQTQDFPETRYHVVHASAGLPVTNLERLKYR